MNSKDNRPQKIIVFAIPSYREADTIGNLTKVIDLGLRTYFKGYRSLIVNADNDSPDNTKAAFLETPTINEKVYLTSRGRPKSRRGKGFHIKMVFEYAKKINAEAVGFIDGDVTSATPKWVKDLIGPVVHQNYDHVLPVYLRHEYDGSITNHLVFPVLYGHLGINIRQPLGGEIAVSRRAVNTFLNRAWYDSAYHYGIDIFLVTESIFHTHRIVQTFLGVKSHKLSAPKLDPMFLEVADSFFRQLAHYSSSARKDRSVRTLPLLVKPGKNLHTPEIPFDYKKLKETTLKEYQIHQKNIKAFLGPLAKRVGPEFEENNHLHISIALWARIVARALAKKQPLVRTELLALRTLFFGRFLTFYREVLDKTHVASERFILLQAKYFRSLFASNNGHTEDILQSRS